MFDEAAFWARFDRSPHPKGCHIWTGNRPGGRYGHVKVNGKTRLVHRVVYELTKGPVPDGHWVLHTCDEEGCGNPEHVYAGTPRQNVLDKMARGHGGFGELHGRHILAEADVRAILAVAATWPTWTRYSPRGAMQTLARRYGVSRMTIFRVVTRRNWKHTL